MNSVKKNTCLQKCPNLVKLVTQVLISFIISLIILPASYQEMFAGNIDDCFRVGVAVKRNMVRLYSKFYSSDIIIASPLGLRPIIGAEG